MTRMSEMARLVGINHVALEVGDIDEALASTGVFAFELRGRAGARMAFIDAGDQFIAIAAGRSPARRRRHATSASSSTTRTPSARRSNGEGVAILPGRGLDFLDPWGNRVQVVQYGEIQFTKSATALEKLGAGGLGKTAEAEAEMRENGVL